MFYLSILLLGLSAALNGRNPEDPGFHKAPAQTGDGVYSILRRYELEGYTCNLTKFYSLNNLKKDAHLVAGREYLLPILIYRFNGKTIRSSVGIKDWDQAVRIQRYNERMLTSKLRDESFTRNRELWVPFHEINCPTPDRPTASTVAEAGETAMNTASPEENGNRRFPIFGEKFAYTPLESSSLSGQVFFIDAGHGGPDPGAMGHRAGRTLCEDEYAYDVALRLCRNLVAHGATAYMITRDPDDGIRPGNFLQCDYDEVLWGGTTMVRALKPRLFQRSNVVNALFEKHQKQGIKSQKLITIHVDSRNHGQQIDLFFYYKPGNEESRSLALQLHQTMKQKYRRYRSTGRYHGTVSARDLHMLRETIPTSVYIELGNIRNNFDQQRVVVEGNRQALANWLFEGLIAK